MLPMSVAVSLDWVLLHLRRRRWRCPRETVARWPPTRRRRSTRQPARFSSTCANPSRRSWQSSSETLFSRQVKFESILSDVFYPFSRWIRNFEGSDLLFRHRSAVSRGVYVCVSQWMRVSSLYTILTSLTKYFLNGETKNSVSTVKGVLHSKESEIVPVTTILTLVC